MPDGKFRQLADEQFVEMQLSGGILSNVAAIRFEASRTGVITHFAWQTCGGTFQHQSFPKAHPVALADIVDVPAGQFRLGLAGDH
jgi:hypothetical protein